VRQHLRVEGKGRERKEAGKSEEENGPKLSLNGGLLFLLCSALLSSDQQNSANIIL